MAGLHRHCHERAERAAAAGADDQARRWMRWADAVGAVRDGRAAAGDARAELAAHCERQVEALGRRGREGPAMRWRAWAAALRVQ